MGRKSEKTLKKKAEKRQESLRLQTARAAVNAANQLEDPMKDMILFKKFERNGLNLSITCHKVELMDEDTKDFVFNITRNNMKPMWDKRESEAESKGYEKSEWGWDDKTKKDEMFDGMARYLIARNQEGKPVAMALFRFDMECDDEVLYCYEIQLSEEVRRKGLGKFLMQVLELMAFKNNMSKLMVTCFKDNAPAQSFFKEKLKYTVDETSPEESLAETMYDDIHYEILSKIMKKKQSTAQQEHCHTNSCC